MGERGRAAVTYPVPLDDAGAPLAGTALEDWLAGLWEDDIKERVRAAHVFRRGARRQAPGVQEHQDKVDARRRKAAGGDDS